MSGDGYGSAGNGWTADCSQIELIPEDAPWLARKDWACGTLYFNPGIDLDMWVPGLLGSIFLGISSAFLWALPGQIRERSLAPILLLLILGPLGIGLTLRTVRLLMRWIKYGGSRLRLETVPIPIGGVCRAELTLSRPIGVGQAVKCQLQCWMATVHEMRSLSASADETCSQDVNYQVKWQDEETVISDGSGTLQVAFAVPHDAPGTSAPNRQFWYFWQLKAEAPGGAVRYHAQFDLPVFKVAPSAAQVRDAKSVAAARQSRQEIYIPNPDLRVRMGPAPQGGTEIIFPPMRSAAHALTQSVVLLVSLGLFIFAFGQLPILVALIWGMVNVLLFGWVVRIWLATERVVIDDDTVSFTSGLFRVRQRMPRAEVSGIHVIAGPMTRRYAIRIRGTGWRHFDVGDGIAEQRDAEWLAAEMSRAAGIQPRLTAHGYQPAEDLEIIQAFAKDVTDGKINFGPLGNALVNLAMRRKNE
jgi:hypothetical protein